MIRLRDVSGRCCGARRCGARCRRAAWGLARLRVGRDCRAPCRVYVHVAGCDRVDQPAKRWPAERNINDRRAHNRLRADGEAGVVLTGSDLGSAGSDLCLAEVGTHSVNAISRKIGRFRAFETPGSEVPTKFEDIYIPMCIFVFSHTHAPTALIGAGRKNRFLAEVSHFPRFWSEPRNPSGKRRSKPHVSGMWRVLIRFRPAQNQGRNRWSRGRNRSQRPASASSKSSFSGCCCDNRSSIHVRDASAVSGNRTA